MYDAIVVGARCAGSPTAMLLARQGHRVLLVDKAAFPSDTMSTHFLQSSGVNALRRWGLIDRLTATGCPPIPKTTMDFGFTAFSPPVAAEGDPAYCPRRTVLDKLLVDAAVEAGAELREGVSVRELVCDEAGAVVGVRGRTEDGTEIEERSTLVIGADGMRSHVAKLAGAATYDERPSNTFGYYSYFSDVPAEGSELYFREGRVLFLFPTHDDLTCIAFERLKPDFHEVRSDLDVNFYKTFEAVPQLAERVRAGKRQERFMGSSDLPNFFRVPYGPGWALVGDAGYIKDPLMGAGITDAFRDAELLAAAVDAGLSGRQPMNAALAGYQQTRDAAAKPAYEMTVALAQLPAPTPRLLAAFGRPPEH